MSPTDEQSLAVVAAAFCATQGLRFTGSAGHGAFKANYRVEHSSGAVLALKVYLPGAVSERAVREVEALQQVAQLRHQCLPSFLALVSFSHGGTAYWISAEEFLAGGCLSDRLVNGAVLPPADVVGLARHLGGAIAGIKNLGLVHRDIKPDNVMFRADRTTAVLVDFGLVRDLSKPSLTKTWLPHGPGTPFFAAAEQLNNDKHMIDWRTDQFSLGVSLAICALGRHPYEHPGDPAAAVVARVAARERPHPAAVSWCQGNGLAPIARMIETWPVARYRTPGEMLVAWANP